MRKPPVLALVVLLLGFTVLAQEPQEKAKIQGEFGINAPATLSPDGKLAAVGSDGSMAGMPMTQIVLWDVAAAKHRAVLKGHKGSSTGSGIRSLRFSADSRMLASGGSDKSIKLWDPDTGKELATLAKDLPSGPQQLAFSADGKILAASCGPLNDFQLKVWTVPDGKELATFSDKIVGSPIALSGDGKTVAWAAKGIKLGDVATSKVIATLEHKGAKLTAFSPDGKKLVSAATSDLKLWDLSSGKEIWTASKKSSGTHLLAFSPDGKKIATAVGPTTGQTSATLKWFDAADGTELTASTFPKNESRIPAISSDGSHALTQFGGQIKLYAVPTK